MIVSFGDDFTADLYHGCMSREIRRFPSKLIRSALRKLDILNAAHLLIDLRTPPGNRLELLKGNFSGYHSIRVNDRWRIVFKWDNNNAYEVSLTDYH